MSGSGVPPTLQGGMEGERGASPEVEPTGADASINALAVAMATEFQNLRASMGQEMALLEGRQEKKLSDAMVLIQQGMGVVNQAAAEASQTATAAGQEAVQAAQAAQNAETVAQQVGSTATLATPPSFAPIKPPPPPRFKGVKGDMKVLEWAHCAQSYLRAAGLEHAEQGVWHVTNFLEEDALTLLTTVIN